MRAEAKGTDRGTGGSTCWAPGADAAVAQSQGHADPHGDLHPQQHGGLEGVAVVPDVQLRDNPPHVLGEVEPCGREKQKPRALKWVMAEREQDK